MTIRRRVPAFFSILLFALSSVWAVQLQQEKVSYAFTGLYNGIISAVAAHVAVPPVDLPGSSIDISNDKEMKYCLSFNRSDLSTYADALIPAYNSDGWYAKLKRSAIGALSPLSTLAVNMLQEADYGYHDAILDGKITVEFSSKTDGMKGWIDLLLVKDWSGVCFSVNLSVVVSGLKVGVPLAFEGLLTGRGDADGGGITVTTEEMNCNGVPVTVEDMNFRLAKGA